TANTRTSGSALLAHGATRTRPRTWSHRPCRTGSGRRRRGCPTLPRLMDEIATEPGKGIVHVRLPDGQTVCGMRAASWTRLPPSSQAVNAGLILYCQVCAWTTGVADRSKDDTHGP